MKKVAFAAVCLVSAVTQAWINGAVWYDTGGHVVNAHGGGVLPHEGRYYLYGEHKVYGWSGNKAHVGVHMYSSLDLESWQDEGVVLSVEDKPGGDIEDGCVLERPKILFCEKTRRFVMYFHLELKGAGYSSARVGIAVAEKVTGPYVFLRSLRPHARVWPIEIPESERQETTLRRNDMGSNAEGNPVEVWGRHFVTGQMCRDMTLFKDEDGTAYHVFASENNTTLHICELTEDYLDYSGRWTRMAVMDSTEAPAVCKQDGWYYLIGSGCTGWAPNAARSYRARAMMGPWERLSNPTRGTNPQNGLGPEKTWGGQSNYILRTFDGRHIAMFDIWNPKNQVDSRLVWLPIEFSGNTISVEWRDLAQL